MRSVRLTRPDDWASKRASRWWEWVEMSLDPKRKLGPRSGMVIESGTRFESIQGESGWLIGQLNDIKFLTRIFLILLILELRKEKEFLIVRVRNVIRCSIDMNRN
jgi:hypothetical protein